MIAAPTDRTRQTVVELVRHASAGQRGRWRQGPDRDRPLDERGRRQAEGLADILRDADHIVSSSFARCVQTVEPLSAVTGVEIVTDVALEELSEVPVTEAGSAWIGPAWLGGRALGLVDRLLESTGHRRIVLCSHGDVVPALLATLVGRDALPLDDVRCRKGGRYRLSFDGGRCVAAEPFPPPDEARVDDTARGGAAPT